MTEKPLRVVPEAGVEFDELETRSGYDLWASLYDREDNPLIALETVQVRELVGEAGGKKLADVGCGTGRHALFFAAAGAGVTGVDFSEGMLEQARSKPGADQVRFVHADFATHIPLDSRAYDVILSCLVLDHISEPGVLFGEMARICRPGGTIVVSVMHPAMNLLGITARFTHPETGRQVRPRSVHNTISDYVMAGAGASLRLDTMKEWPVDDDLARRSPRAAKYLGWPLLLTMRWKYSGTVY
jgi:malonyl-CoA O-methyltransferase